MKSTSKFYGFFLFLLLSLSIQAQKNLTVTSPDGAIKFNILLIHQQPFYNVYFRDKKLIDNSKLSLSFLENGSFGNNIKFLQPVTRTISEDYELIAGKSHNIHSECREMVIMMEENKSPKRKLSIAVRVFNDGVAFRYEIPGQPGWTNLSLTEENDEFRLANNPTVHCLFLPNFTTSHEGEYSTMKLDEVQNDTLIDMPALFEFPGQIFIGITEANLLDYAGMYLEKQQGILRSVLSPLPHRDQVKVKAALPHHSPWRVMLISNRIGALIESNIITDLAEPCKVKDISWIKPGKTTFPWWNGNVLPDTINAPGNNFATAKYYIDFCARNNIEYHSVVEYGLHEWYVNDGAGFVPGPHVDVTHSVPGLDMKEVCDYAASVGVGIRVWVYWSALYPRLEEAFTQFEKWGLKGLMVDFMDRDDQEMVNIQEKILQSAAVHHLHIQFHGAYKPTGLNRTYPNEFTREGTLNYEANKWSHRVNPDHDINMPFTRMLAGSTDYHLGGFRAVTDTAFIIQYTRPLMLGTRCHMLAMYVVLENYLGMVCDYPAAYEGQPGFDFLKIVPTVWDETKVLDAKVAEFITIARKKNNEWFVGSITNHQSREINIPLHFLNEGNYVATIYSDAADAEKEPNHLNKEIRNVTKNDVIKLQLSAGGGEVIHLAKSK